MRLLIYFRSLKTVAQNQINNSKYYSGMHGWIYRKLENTNYSDMYLMSGYKKFCFGNLYPIKNNKIEEGESYKLLISSPDEMLMVNLISNIDHDEIVNLGEYSFKLEGLKPIPSHKINDYFLINSETITNICLPVDGILKPKAITLTKNPERFKEQLQKNLITGLML